MIDLLIALVVAFVFLVVWLAARFISRTPAIVVVLVVEIGVVVLATTAGLSGPRDWLMVGLVICVIAVVSVAGRTSRRKAFAKPS
jgi:FtsH-binding integral membrane protein